MNKSKHIHRLRKHKLTTGNKVYFCTLPDCNFKVAVPLVLGKRVLCNRCNQPFIMNEYSMRLVKPHCDKCLEVRGSTIEISNATTKGTSKVIESAADALRKRLTASIGTLINQDQPDEDVEL